ncbi:MAG TPA: luciferase family protein [Solirubrobacterales bacterium]
MEGAFERINEEVLSWPGVEAGTGKRGEWSFKLGPREVGHLHGDHAAHFMFGKELGTGLKAEGRVVDHPVFPGKPGPGARRIESDEDVADVIELMRLNYDRIAAAHGVSEPA